MDKFDFCPFRVCVSIPAKIKFEIDKIWNADSADLVFSNFSCKLLNIFSNVLMYYIWETSRIKFKKHSVSKIVLTFDCLNKLYLWSRIILQVSTFCLKLQKFFSITRSSFSSRKSKQFWKQNTIIQIKKEKQHMTVQKLERKSIID